MGSGGGWSGQVGADLKVHQARFRVLCLTTRAHLAEKCILLTIGNVWRISAGYATGALEVVRAVEVCVVAHCQACCAHRPKRFPREF